MYKILNIILNGINRRPFLVLINLLTFMFSFYCLKSLFGFLNGYHVSTSENLTEEMNDTLNGIAGLLVALGVLLESREVIMKITRVEHTTLDVYLNEVAEHNGLGLLLIGLFMEIITLMIEIPNTVVDTRGVEIYLFSACFLLIAISMLIELDFVKDFIKTYFVPADKLLIHEKNSTHEEK